MNVIGGKLIISVQKINQQNTTVNTNVIFRLKVRINVTMILRCRQEIGVLKKARGSPTVQGSARKRLSQFGRIILGKVRRQCLILLLIRCSLINLHNAFFPDNDKSDDMGRHDYNRNIATNNKSNKRNIYSFIKYKRSSITTTTTTVMKTIRKVRIKHVYLFITYH